MSFEAWIIFALFWVVFVTTPGPNAVNCISNGMSLPFGRAMIGVLAILTQATAFLILSALGVTALITASPTAFFVAKLIGQIILFILAAICQHLCLCPHSGHSMSQLGYAVGAYFSVALVSLANFTVFRPRAPTKKRPADWRAVLISVV